MEILESISKAYNVFIRDLRTPKSFRDGEKFEDFARDIIFPDFIYKLIEKTHKYQQNKDDYVESSKNPDYKFECPETKRQFYMECKYRDITKIQDYIEKISKKVFGKEKQLKGRDRIQICEDYQLRRYKEINQNTPVFMLLGFFDGIDIYEDFAGLRIFLLPVEDIINIYVSLFSIDYYIIPNNHFIIPPRLWELIDKKYIEKSYCIRCGNNIKFSDVNPLCYNCWQQWFKYSNYTYKEKFCHKCRKEAEVSVARPVCLDCYKVLNRVEK